MSDPIRVAYAEATGAFRSGISQAIESLRRTDPKLARRLADLIVEINADIAAAWGAQREVRR